MSHAWPQGMAFDRTGSDFVDRIVDSAMRSLKGQLKAEFHRELRRTSEEQVVPAYKSEAEPLAAVACLPNMPDAANMGTDKTETIRISDGGRVSTLRRGSARSTNADAIMRFTTDEIAAIGIVRNEQRAKEEEGERIYTRKFDRSISGFNLPEDVEELPKSKQLAISIVGSRYFDFMMGVIIILNAGTIGLETSSAVSGEKIPKYLVAIEYILLLIYTLEIALRFYAAGVKESLMNNWVRFDLVLVLAGVLKIPLTVFDVGDFLMKVIDNVNMLKMLRLARLARTVRVLVQFRTLWLLAQGLMYSVLPMFWTCIIMVCVVYMFAIVGMEMIVDGSDDPEFAVQAENFKSIPQSMMTLLQFITLDSMAAIYRPLINERPFLTFYFLTFFLLGPIALMNIVTAIMVESSLRTANEDIEAKKAWETLKKKQAAPKLRNIFGALDPDCNGELDIEEIRDAPEHIREHIAQIANLEDMEEVFHMLDLDANGRVSIDEFVDGILRSQADKPSELIVLMKQGRKIIDTLELQRQQIIDALDLQNQQEKQKQDPQRAKDAPGLPDAISQSAPVSVSYCTGVVPIA